MADHFLIYLETALAPEIARSPASMEIGEWVVIEEGGSVGDAGWYMPILRQSFEIRARGRVAATRSFAVRLSAGQVSAVRPFESRIGGRDSSVRTIALQFAARREPAEQWNRILADDEDLIMALLGS